MCKRSVYIFTIYLKIGICTKYNFNVLSAESGDKINGYIISQLMVYIAEANGLIKIFILLGGNNFNASVKDPSVHNSTVKEIISNFKTLLDFSDRYPDVQIHICSLIPRPRFKHLDLFFKKTSIGLSQLCKKYNSATFIDCHSLFQNSIGQTLLHFYNSDGIHLRRFSSEKLALHVFNSSR